MLFLVFFFKRKTAYEMRISDWSSDVCSSDLRRRGDALADAPATDGAPAAPVAPRKPRPRKAAPNGGATEKDADQALAYLDREDKLEQRLGKYLNSERAAERRGGQGGVRPCRCRWSQSQ